MRKIFVDKQEKLFEMAKKYDVDLLPIYDKESLRDLAEKHDIDLSKTKKNTLEEIELLCT